MFTALYAEQNRRRVASATLQAARAAKLGELRDAVRRSRNSCERDLEPVLRETETRCGETELQLERETEKAAEAKQTAADTEKSVNAMLSEISKMREEAQQELNQALPALEEANRCLSKLKTDHLREVRAFFNPPSGVRMTMEVLCIIFQVPPAAQKQLLTDPKKLLDSLMGYDRESPLPAKTREKLESYINREDFEPAVIRKASVACEAICMWTRAMYRYAVVAEHVKPKRERLKEVESSRQKVQKQLDTAMELAKLAEERVQKLAAIVEQVRAKRERLDAEFQTTQIQIAEWQRILQLLDD
ncbi:unnamed protein product, partial [Amoebophrya sp. A120]|eukprot:GSA120T00017363001.1